MIPSPVSEHNIDRYRENPYTLNWINILRTHASHVAEKRSLIQQWKEIIIFTDGSLNKKWTFDNQIAMGFGDVFFSYEEKEDPIHIEQLNGRVKGTPSSFRAELMAIAVTLAMIRTQKKVHIDMDSQAVIVAIKEYVDKSIYRKTTYYKCGLVFEFIKEIIQRNQLTVFLYKIEWYLNHKWNDLSDNLVCMG